MLTITPALSLFHVSTIVPLYAKAASVFRKQKKLLQQQLRPAKKMRDRKQRRLRAKLKSWLPANEKWMRGKPRTAPCSRSGTERCMQGAAYTHHLHVTPHLCGVTVLVYQLRVCIGAHEASGQQLALQEQERFHM